MASDVSPVWILLAAVFGAILLLVQGLYWAVEDRRRSGRPMIGRRLGLHAEEVREATATIRRRDGALNAFSRFLLKTPGAEALTRELVAAGSGLSAPRALTIVLVVGVLLLNLMLALGFGLLSSLGVTAGLAVGAPWLLLKRQQRKRAARFLAQLPDAIDMMVRSLRAGHPVAATIELVARETADPVRSEFAITFDETSYGLDLRDAFDNLAARMPLRELHYLAVLVRLQHATGGNLAETLEVLSRVIRARQQMKGKIRALSAEGRLSAMVLSALPFLVAGAIWALNPKYYADVPDDPVITIGLAIAAAQILLALIVMQRLVNFRI